MTKQQKTIILILGILNLIIIGAIAGVIAINTIRPTAPNLSVNDPCIEHVLSTLPSATRVRRITWNAQRLELKLYYTYGVETPPDGSAQFLWNGLDSIALALRQGCVAPEIIVVTVTAQGQATTHHHIAEFDGPDVKAWANGTLSESDLSERGRYRHITP